MKDASKIKGQLKQKLYDLFDDYYFYQAVSHSHMMETKAMINKLCNKTGYNPNEVEDMFFKWQVEEADKLEPSELLRPRCNRRTRKKPVDTEIDWKEILHSNRKRY